MVATMIDNKRDVPTLANLPHIWARRAMLVCDSIQQSACTRVQKILASREGNVAIEFALLAPLLAFMLLGGFELSQMVLAQIKNSRVAATVSDLASRADALTESDIDDIFRSGRSVGTPLDYQANGRIILTSVLRRPSDRPRVVWQRAFPAAAAGESQVGSPGKRASLGAGFTMQDGENIIVTETIFNYTPFSSTLIVGTQPIYAQSFSRPRGSNIEAVDP